MALNENVQWLYDSLKGKGIDLGTPDEFNTALSSDKETQDWAYNKGVEYGFDLGSQDEFLSGMGIAQQQAQQIQQPAQPLNPSVKDNPAPTTEEEYQESRRIQDEASGATENPNDPYAHPMDDKARNDFMLQNADKMRRNAEQMSQRAGQMTIPEPSLSLSPKEGSIAAATERMQQDNLRETNKRIAAQVMLKDIYSDRDALLDEMFPNAKLDGKSMGELTDKEKAAMRDGLAQNDPYLKAADNILMGAGIRLNDARRQKGVSWSNVGNGIVSFAKDATRHLLGDMEGTLSFGISDIRYAMIQRQVLKKIADAEAYDNPEQVLTPQEKVLYDAIAANIAVEIARQNDTSRWSKAGKITADMIPFVVGIMAGNALFKGMGNAARKAITQTVEKTVKNKLAKWLLINVPDVAISAGESALTATILPRTYAKMYENAAQVDMNKLDMSDDYRLKIGGVDQQSIGKSWAQAEGEQIKEIFTETGGNFRLIGRALIDNPIGKKILKTPFGMVLKRFEGAQGGAGSRFASMTMYHGVLGEWLEELEGAIYDGNLKEFFTADTQLPMLLSFSVPAAFTGGLNATQHAFYQAKYDQAGKRIDKLIDGSSYLGPDKNTIKGQILATLYQTPMENIPEAIGACVEQVYPEEYKALMEGAPEKGNKAAELAYAFKEYISSGTVLTAFDPDMLGGQIADVQEHRQQMRQQAEQMAKEEVESISHADGNIYRVGIKGRDDAEGYAKSGALNIEQDENGLKATGRDLVTVKMTDGTVEQVPADELTIFDEPTSAQDRMQAISDHLFAQYANNDVFRIGDKVYLTKDGQNIIPQSSTITGIDDEGVHVESIDEQGQPQDMVIPHEQAAEMLAVAEGETEDGIVTFNMPDSPELRLRQVGDGVYETIEPVDGQMFTFTDEDLANMGATRVDMQQPETPEEAAQTEEQQPQQPSYPTDENGNPAWNEIEQGQAAQLLYDRYKGNTVKAQAVAEDMLKEAQKVQKQAAKQTSHNLNLDERDAENEQYDQMRASADAAVNYWQNVKLAISQIKTEEEKAAIEAQQQMMQQAREQRSKTEEGTVTASTMAERYAAADKIEGSTGTMTLPDGRELNGRYMLIAPQGVTPSHDVTNNFQRSEGYPVTSNGQSINDRDYTSDQEEQQKVVSIAQNFNGNAIKNMPVISDEGLVYNGNGRMMAGQLTALNGTDAAYTQSLMNNAAQYGFTPEQVASIPNARVVFQLDERLPYSTQSLTIFNEQETQTQSNTGKAAGYARKLTPQAVSEVLAAVDGFNTIDAFFSDKKAPFNLINSLINAGIIAQREKAEMVDGDKLSATGRERLSNILFGTVFDNETIRLMGDDAALKNSILRALPQILNNKSLAEFSLEADINDAIRLLYQVRNAGMPFRSFVSQTVIAEDGQVHTAAEGYTPYQLLLAEEMSEGGVDAFRNVLTAYNNEARNVQGGQVDIFGDLLTPTQLKNLILQRYGKEPNEQERPSAGREADNPVEGTPASNEQEVSAAEFLNEALAEVAKGNIPSNISIDESTIRDDINSAEMDARLLIDGKPSNLSVTIFDQSLGSRGGYNPANLVKYYPFDNADNWFWEKADILADLFNKGEHTGKASVLDESDAVYFSDLQAAMEFAEFVNSDEANSDEVRLAVAEAETDTNPTEAQKKAENYKQGHVTLWGLPITIENPKGSIRRGTDANGKQWEQEMHHTYGKIRRTEGVDGDHIDVFLGPNLNSERVFVVDQLNVNTKEFDEHKVMLGFDSLEDAQNGYMSNYEKGWQGMGTVTEVTMDEFKKWIDSSHRKTKPFSEYKGIKKEAGQSAEQTPIPELSNATLRKALAKVINSWELGTRTFASTGELEMLEDEVRTLVKKHKAPTLQAALDVIDKSIAEQKARGDVWIDAENEQEALFNLSMTIIGDLFQAEKPKRRRTTKTEDLTLLELAQKRKAERETETQPTENRQKTDSQPTVKANETETQSDQGNFSGNKVFTADRVAAARERLRKRRNNLNMGLNPEDAVDYAIIGGAYVEQGVREFTDFCRVMLRDLGNAVRPYLQSVYDSLRQDPEVKAQGWQKEFSSHDIVDNFDVENFDENAGENGTEIVQSTINNENNVKKSPENLQESEKSSTFAGENNKDNGNTENNSGRVPQTNAGISRNAGSKGDKLGERNSVPSQLALAELLKGKSAEEQHQIAAEWAKEQGILVDFPNYTKEHGLSIFANGNENDNWLDTQAKVVYKMNNLMHSADKIGNLIERVELYNEIFPETKLSLWGFSSLYGSKRVHPIYTQQFIDNAEHATQEQIDELMRSKGFEPTGNRDGEYSNGQYIVSDALPKNALVIPNGTVAVIDADVKRAGQGGSGKKATFEKGQNETPDFESPMMKQFREIKKQYPDATLMFRVGDFYELYEEDAETASKILGITLTHNKDGRSFAGFPFHALDTYLPKLVRAGKRVAICDQLEDPKIASKLVKRDVTEQHEQQVMEKAQAEVAKPEPQQVVTDTVGEITESKHTKTGATIYVVKPLERVGNDEFKVLKRRAKENNGYYSTFAKGFVFNSENDANRFNNISDEQTTTEQTSADTETVISTAEATAAEAAAVGESAGEEIKQPVIEKIDAATEQIDDQVATLAGIETRVEEVPELPANATVADVLDQAKKRSTRNKQVKKRKEELQQVLDLFADEPINENENGNTDQDTEGTSGAAEEEPAAVGSDGTQSNGRPQTGTAQEPSGARDAGVVADGDAGEIGGETQPTAATGSQQSGSKRGSASGPFGRVSSGNVERKQSLKLSYRDEFGVEHILDANYYTLGDVYHINDRLNGDQYNVKASNVLKNIKSKVWTEIAVTDPTIEHGDTRTDDHSLRTPKEKNTPLNTRNYLYPEDAGAIDNMTPSERMLANVEALETLRNLMVEGREATPEERAILGKLRGWGGVNVPDNYQAKYNRLTLTDVQKRLVDVVNQLDPNGERKLLDSLRTASHTSYYTPIPIARAMHAVAMFAGYKGNGNMLDPSMGNGVFEGSMPKGMQQSTNIRGIELDWLTGQIAQRLYPDARINITGFQDAHIPQDYYDYVVSNIPFGSLQITDLDWTRNPSPIRKAAQGKIHNYFAVKMIESTRPGGLCVIMTSNAIMDTAGNQLIRDYITDTCEVLGAVRLPNNTFKGAGTKVVTDVIFLRKFKNAEDRIRFMERGDYWSDIATPFNYTESQTLYDRNGNPHEVTYSKYYQEHPDNMIGRPFAGGQYSGDAYDLESSFTTDELANRIVSLGRKMLDERKQRFGNITIDTTTPRAEIIEKVKEAYKGNGKFESSGNIVIQDGKIGKLENIKEGNTKTLMFSEQKVGSASVAQITDYTNLRSLLKELIHAQIENYTDDRIDDIRKQMQQAYTAYVKKYGKLQDKKNAFIEEDIDGFQVRALEQWKDGKFVGMADIYTKNTITSERDMNNVSDPQAAVLNSLAAYGNINADYLQSVLGDNFAEQCAGLIFEDPTNQGEYIARDVYLSGDVVTKLEYAKAIAAEDSRFQPNVDALEAIQPKRKEFGEFPCHMGARWIPVQIYNDFLNDIFGISGSRKGQKTGIVYMEATNEYIFNFDAKELGGKAANYATRRKRPQDIFQAALLDRDITVTYKDEDGKDRVDQDETDAARDKVAELRDAFEDWVPQNQERVQQLTDTYNSVFNRHVLPTYNGQHLNIVGLQGMTLRPHQKDAVWRIINQRGGIIDHIVGAGKSLVMQASIMEMRRMGIAKKPMILALKSTTQQIATEFHQAFPAARVLAPTEDDFSVKNRKRFLAQIAVNDYDCIILSHEQYSALDHTDHIKRSFIEDQISQLDNLLEYLYGQADQTQLTKKQLKGLEKRKENLKEKLKKLELIKTDEEFVFENLGVDYLFVDECQAFKNLMFQTSYDRVAGLGDPAGSERSTKLLYGIRALQEMHQGDMGTVFLSGTTITNSLSELYNIFNYLRPNEMKRMGLNTFDAWASTFAVRSTEAEFGVTNELKEKSRFRKFEGLQELSRLYTEIADVRNDNNLELPKPKLHTIFVPIPISDTMKRINDAITNMVRNMDGTFFGINPVDKKKYPWSLSATNLAKQATLSPKLIDTKYDDENGKIFHVCENIAKIYKQFDAQKGVQLIFCDNGVPTPGKKYDAYTDIIKRLTKDYGIPRSEIVDIHDANSDEKRQELFRKVNDGKVRILIGGTTNMGTGVNVQKRVVAMHHLDIPWTPADVNQRNGRGSRQGNEIARDYNNNQVDAYYYAVERTLDTYRYQLQDVKGRMIENFKMANVGVDEFDEGSDEMSAAEMVAVLSGNPVILDKAKQDKLVDKLKRAQRSSLTEYARRRAEYDAMLQSQSNMEGLIRRNQEDIETLKRNGFEQDAQGNWPPLQVTLTEYERTTSGTTYDKATDAGKAIHDRIKKTGTAYLHAFGISARVVDKVDDQGQTTLSKELEAITYSGIKYSVALSDDDTAAGQAMQNLLKKIYSNGESYKRRLEEINHKLDGADPGEYTFPRQAELDEAVAKKREIDAEYNKLVVSDKKPKKTEEPEKQLLNLEYDAELTDAQELATSALIEALNDNTDLDVFLATDEQMPEDAEASIVSDKQLMRQLEQGEKLKVYRAMVEIDGKLYPPMSSKDNETRKLRKPIELGQWEQAEERPDLAYDKDGKRYFRLRKDDGTYVDAAYNPYFHTSRSPLNDQFIAAYKRPNLVTVEVEVPVSELTSGYKADRAKDTVGEISWHSGVVSSQLAALGNPRKVILSRYDKPIRIVPDAEVAEKIAGMLQGTDIAIHYNVVTPSLRAELEKQGVTISSTPSGTVSRDEMRKPDGKLYGWAVGDRIYLTKDGINPNTPIHEYTHLWARAMRGNNREGWQSIVNIFKDTPMWDEVKTDKNYAGLTTDDAICSEVLARYSGTRGAARMEEAAAEMLDEAQQSGSILGMAKARQLISRVRKALSDFWQWVGTNLFGIKRFDSAEQVADRVLWDMLNGTELKPEDQTTTNNFKQWFGDWQNDPEHASKVVDENGKPLVVYHATPNKFTVFDKSKIGSTSDPGSMGHGFYFTPQKSFAARHGQNLMSVYLNIRNPYIGNDELRAFIVGFQDTESAKRGIDAYMEYYKRNGELDEELARGLEQMKSQITEDLIKEMSKYDGVISYNRDGTMSEIVAVNSNQIKSATDNNGEFSEDNDNIEMMISGYTQEKQRIYNEWYAAHPRPTYNYGETLKAFEKRLFDWEAEREKYRDQLKNWKPMPSEAEKVDNPESAGAPAFIPGVRPTPMANETPGEYALRLKQYYQLMRDENMVADYVAEINAQADATAKVLKKNTLVRGLLDAAKPIENFQEWMKERGAELSSNSNAYQYTFLATGRVTDVFEVLWQDKIDPLAKQIGKIIAPDKKTGKSRLDGIDLVWKNMDVPGTGIKIDGNKITPREIVGIYCQAKDCQEAIELGLPDRGEAGFKNNTGMTYDNIINAVESAIPTEELNKLWELIRKATHYALEYDHKAGRITDDTFEEFSKRQFYVPQRGWRERSMNGRITEYKPMGKRYDDPYNAALITARGRQTLAEDPFAYIVSIDASSIISSENNKIKQKFLQFCLDNENLGLKTGAFRIKKYWIMNIIDPNTGKVQLDGEGNPMMDVSYVAPSAEDFNHDKEVKALIKQKRKELAKVNRAFAERQAHDELGPQLEAAYKTKIAEIEQTIEDLEQTMHIAWHATHSALRQRTDDEEKQNEVRILSEGQEYVIELEDEKLANAVNLNFKQHQEELFNTTGRIRNATRFMSAMLTQYNPEFAASNFVRDYQVALATLMAEHRELVIPFIKNFAACQPAVWQYAFNDKVKGRREFQNSEMGRYLQEYFEAGAATGFSYMQDLKSLRHDFDAMINESNLRRGIKGAVGLFSILTEVSETAVRFAGYVSARQAGWDVEAAAFMSKELTTNFDRAGEIADTGWMSWFSFFRATLNGNIKFLKALKKMPLAYSLIAASYFAMGIANQLLNPDDPDDEIWASDYTRQSNFVIWKFRIPAAHFLRMFFAAGVNTAKWLQNEKSFGEATYNTATFATQELLPNYLNVLGNGTEWNSREGRVDFIWEGLLQGVMPSPVSPIADVYFNRDFRGATINREPFTKSEEGTKDILLAKENTLPVYKWLTQAIYESTGGSMNTKYQSADPAWRSWLFDTSASSVEHVVEGYMPAGMDMFITVAEAIYDAATGTPTGPDKWPFVRKFYNVYTPERAYIQQYYLLNGRIKEFERNMRDYQKNDKARFNMLRNSQEYRTYLATKKLVGNEKQNPTTADVNALRDANKKWLKK